MGRVWSDEGKFQRWLDVEMAATETLAERGVVPLEAAARIRERARADDYCYGQGHGFFEWVLPLAGADISRARRIRVLAEASSHRIDTPQTDDDIFPTTIGRPIFGTAANQGRPIFGN